MRVATAVASLILALSGTARAAPAADGGAVSIDVPYVPQTEALCGGAAAAMVLRYWGAAHTGVQEFAPLVDRGARGIKTDALVNAIERRSWRTSEMPRSLALLQTEIANGHPTIILIEARPGRYHHVVVVGAAPDHVVVHDPTWGPSRRIAAADLDRRWTAAQHWSLVILPGDRRQPAAAAVDRDAAPPADRANLADRVDVDDCEHRLAAAINQVQARGLGSADAILGEVRSRCPASAGPLRELAGVRFAQHQWSDAARLADEAVRRDPHDWYAWDVLASSRFMQDDVPGALSAWNEIGKPRLDDVRIDGLRRTKYALVANALRLETGSLLTAERFERAERRLEELPGMSSARIGVRPDTDGFASLDVALVESPARPRGAIEWTARGLQTIVDREVNAAIPGTSGEGGLWSASWRWWNNRPAVAISFATPHSGFLPGVWRVDGMWEQQTYQLSSTPEIVREDHARGSLTVADWLTAHVHYELSAGVDAWSRMRAASVGGTIERRSRGDRIAIAGSATAWTPVSGERSFGAASIRARLRSSTAASGTVWRADSSFEAVSAAAPLSLWLGAGDGHARPPLLRAHDLVSDGIIAGPVFGRELAYATGEVQRWIGSSAIRWAVAGFVDAARASRRDPAAPGDPFQVDAGIGLRIRPLGQRGALRVDFGRGLRDGSEALTVGWQY